MPAERGASGDCPAGFATGATRRAVAAGGRRDERAAFAELRPRRRAGERGLQHRRHLRHLPGRRRPVVDLLRVHAQQPQRGIRGTAREPRGGERAPQRLRLLGVVHGEREPGERRVEAVGMVRERDVDARRRGSRPRSPRCRPRRRTTWSRRARGPAASSGASGSSRRGANVVIIATRSLRTRRQSCLHGVVVMVLLHGRLRAKGRVSPARGRGAVGRRRGRGRRRPRGGRRIATAARPGAAPACSRRRPRARSC